VGVPTEGNDSAVKKSLRIIGGSTTTLTGVVLLVLPGPGIPLIIVGLGILAKDIPLAAHWHGKVLHHSRRAANGVGRKFGRGRNGNTGV